MIGVWEGLGVAAVAGGAMSASLMDEVLGDLGWEGAIAYEPFPQDRITEKLWPHQLERHGDGGNWKFKGKKPGGSTPGKKPGDVKYYEYWIDAYRKWVEVHYFRDAAGNVKFNAPIDFRPLPGPPKGF